MKAPPEYYFTPCVPGKGVLVNGQYYRTNFGRSTLEMMVNDGAFGDSEDTTDRLAEVEAESENQQAQIDRLQNRIFELVTQLKEAKITPCDPGRDSELGDLEGMEDGDEEGKRSNG
jgi:hypothetical protein